VTNDVIETVTAANAEFYAAFEACDIERMEAIWDPGDDIRCIHPGWPLLSGRSRVMRSWSVLMANTAYIQFFLTHVDVQATDDLAVVTCEENILTGIDDAEHGLGGSQRVVSTNVFRRRGDDWLLWVHHGSPVLDANEAG
jgi:ketosteroid isomerase-like protein